MKCIENFEIYFSHSQFFIYDGSARIPAYDWTESHSSQGFARKESSVSFGTILEFGKLEIEVNVGKPDDFNEYERVIGVPFRVVSGLVFVGGPEEADSGARIPLVPGFYRLVVAQVVVDEEGLEKSALYFEPLTASLEKSSIIKSDEYMNPPASLVETVNYIDD